MQPEGSSSSAPQKAPRYVLALDLGSGSIKAAVVSNAGIVVSVAAEPVTTQTTRMSSTYRFTRLKTPSMPRFAGVRCWR